MAPFRSMAVVPFGRSRGLYMIHRVVEHVALAFGIFRWSFHNRSQSCLNIDHANLLSDFICGDNHTVATVVAKFVDRDPVASRSDEAFDRRAQSSSIRVGHHMGADPSPTTATGSQTLAAVFSGVLALVRTPAWMGSICGRMLLDHIRQNSPVSGFALAISSWKKRGFN